MDASDVQTWDGTKWSPRPATVSPPGRWFTNLAFDQARGNMVMFGGAVAATVENDTWTYGLQANPPSSTIISPGIVFARIGDQIATTFSCQEGTGGPGVAMCKDSNGDTSPGQLDTSTLGSKTYKVTATSQNGLTSTETLNYTVNKASAGLTASGATSAEIGETITVDTSLTGGYQPTGDITFLAYGPDSANCANLAFTSSPVTISGPGKYSSPEFTPTEPGTYRWRAWYSGDVNNTINSSTACNAADSVSTIDLATPSVSASGATSGQIGQSITVDATLGTGYQPTGSITFRAYGPGDETCAAGPVFTSSEVAISGAGTYSSPGFTPTEPGTYRWQASYSGDANNNAGNPTSCDAADAVSTIAKASPEVTLAAATSEEIGGSVNVDATLSSGYQPTGELTFIAYGPEDPTCTGTPAFTSGEVTVTENSTQSGPDFTPAEAGVYRWQVSYSGDANNTAFTSPCDAADSVSTIEKATTSVSLSDARSVEVGDEITVDAALTGGHQPIGSVTFTAYGPDDATCSGEPAFRSGEIEISGNGNYRSPAFTPIVAGNYRWLANYSGDRNNQPDETGCNDSGSVSTVTDKPVPPPPVCPARKLDFSLHSFKPKKPFGTAPKTPGILARLTTGAKVMAEITPRIRYRTGKTSRTVKLKTRTIRVNGFRQLRFRLPAKMKRQLVRATGRIYRHQVTLQIRASLRLKGTPNDCFQKPVTRKLRTRLTSVSSRVALRRMSWTR